MPTRYVAFLRAVNVGNRRVQMADLRDRLEAAGLDEVSTYIASGNAIFTSTSAPADLEPQIEQAVQEGFGWLAEAFVRTADRVTEIAARRPFGTVSPEHTHLVAFLRAAPTAAERAAIESLSGAVDTLEVHGSEVHWHIRGRSMATELKTKDWKGAGAGLNTTRNITMLAKLATKLTA